MFQVSAVTITSIHRIISDWLGGAGEGGVYQVLPDGDGAETGTVVGVPVAWAVATAPEVWRCLYGNGDKIQYTDQSEKDKNQD